MNRPSVIDRATLPNAVEPLQEMVLEMAAQLDGLRARFDAQMESLRHQLVERGADPHRVGIDQFLADVGALVRSPEDGIRRGAPHF